ncbi:hypothetical protein INT80_12590, partial [Gallibacterium anatis]|nr:hypothetical protein [Gallibacterium anatis]
TENRAAGIGVGLFGNIGRLMSIYTAIGIGIHNLLTYNPDFEIGKILLIVELMLLIKNNNLIGNKFIL